MNNTHPPKQLQFNRPNNAGENNVKKQSGDVAVIKSEQK